MGSSDLEPRRRYHGLLVASPTAPDNRRVYVHGISATFDPLGCQGNDSGLRDFELRRFALSRFRFAPDVLHPQAQATQFSAQPWPTWRFEINKSISITLELVMSPASAGSVFLRYRIRGSAQGLLCLRPFVSARNYHLLSRGESYQAQALGSANTEKGSAAWRLQDGLNLYADSGGSYQADACWYHQFLYRTEAERGFDCIEDLLSPGIFSFTLSPEKDQALLGFSLQPFAEGAAFERRAKHIFSTEQTRRSAPALSLMADAYVIQRTSPGRKTPTHSIIAGYPWFTDWGRDTFISMRGLCLATGRLDECVSILDGWSDYVDQGLLPNRFPDAGDAPEYNSVDAALWFVIVAGEVLSAAKSKITDAARQRILKATQSILQHYWQGTEFGIHADSDGLLAAGIPGQQLTWMDARADRQEVTPRIGKPIEVQALWINALSVACSHLPEGKTQQWQQRLKHAMQSLHDKAWNPHERCLYDVLDENHVSERHNAQVRPNQIFTVGGLPLSCVRDSARALAIVSRVEEELLTPYGLRTLSPKDPHYAAHYQGGPSERDRAYHQGTVWPWLLGAFVEAWLRVQGNTPQNRAHAYRRFVAPLAQQLDTNRIGHLSEIFDAENPYRANGCPFQAWSLGEFIRTCTLLADAIPAELKAKLA
jgi:predicted glycogen debranching enzyme